MTLVRIDLIEGRRSPVQLEILADTVHSTIVEVFGAAITERYQIITEHRPGGIITFDSGLGKGRADDVVVIQIVQSRRTQTQKRALYRELTERLHDRLSLHEDDLIITIIENTHADWSFTDATEPSRDGNP
jgi:phenylpyruvate tautomerase PptA (4-oxalocrotonate tautomerase family)